MDVGKYRRKLIGNKEERAVSPVIGVILMVAITVILAAVIAAFVLDIGDLDDSAPNAQFDWESVEPESGDNYVEVTHTSGDDIDISSIEVSGEGSSQDGGDVEISDDDGDWTAGQSAQINPDNEDATGSVDIVWSGDGSSTVITSYDYDFS